MSDIAIHIMVGAFLMYFAAFFYLTAQLHKIHLQMNSRLDELIVVSKAVAYAAGVANEKLRQSSEDTSHSVKNIL